MVNEHGTALGRPLFREEFMIRQFILAGAVAGAVAFPAMADPIEGNWKTQSGETAGISSCGGSFCIKLKTGTYAGKQIGKMNANGANKYKGSITDPTDNKTYSGSATLSGSVLKMKGCVLAVLCKTQTWNKI